MKLKKKEMNNQIQSINSKKFFRLNSVKFHIFPSKARQKKFFLMLIQSLSSNKTVIQN